MSVLLVLVYEVTALHHFICVLPVADDVEHLFLQVLPNSVPALVKRLHILVRSVMAVFLHISYLYDMDCEHVFSICSPLLPGIINEKIIHFSKV